MGVKGRKIKVEGWFNLLPEDGAISFSLEDLKQDGLAGQWGLTELDDLKLLEVVDEA